jgi:CDP-diacylglycerol--glycerol-3-phosphate 3-phosphatidyltransferase/cardiolipin synthase
MAMTSISRGGSHRWSLPNLLTYGRIVAVPLVVACMYWPQVDAMRWTAFTLYAAAAVTDFFDGYLARAWSQQSALGQMLDPIADKLLVASVLLMLVADRTITGGAVVAAIVILCREMLVSGLREFLAKLEVSVPVSNVAKWKTTAQLLALGFLICGPAGDKVLPYNTEIGLTLLWVAASLTIYTGWDYLVSGIRHIIAIEG